MEVYKVVWKFGRWHHQVDYSPFRRNALRLKPGVVPTVGPDEYGMRLVRTNAVEETEAESLRDDSDREEV